MKNKRLTLIFAVVALLLLIPFTAMQFTSEVDWSRSDFIIAAILLLGTGLSIELVLRKVKDKKHRMLFSLSILAILFVVWAELAVGIFGSPFAGS